MSKKDLPYLALCLCAIILVAITVSSFKGGTRSAVSETGNVFIYEVKADSEMNKPARVFIENKTNDYPVKVKLEQHWSTGIGGITDSRIQTITLAPSEKRSLGLSETEVAFIKGSNYYKILNCNAIK